MNQEQIIRGLRISEFHEDTSDRLRHPPLSVNAVFLSDVHLFSPGCRAQELVDFLNHVIPKYIYLVGDVIDGWGLGITRLHHIGRLFKPGAKEATQNLRSGHTDVIQKLLRHERKGSYIFYIPGNHDDFLRPSLRTPIDLPEETVDKHLSFLETSKALTERKKIILGLFNDIAQTRRIVFLHNIVHKTVDDRRFLVQHGDEFDLLIKNQRLLSIIGTKARDQLFHFSKWLTRNDEQWIIHQITRNLFKMNDGFSLAQNVERIKTKFDIDLPELAVAFVEKLNKDIEKKRLSNSAWENQPLLDGIVVGHNHIPAALSINKIAYFNCGDWMGNNTAAIEHTDGRMEIMGWNSVRGVVSRPAFGEGVVDAINHPTL